MKSAVWRVAAARASFAVAGEVGELDDLVALVVMPEDHEAIAERPLGSGDPGVHFVVGQAEITIRERLALADALLLDLVQEMDIHSQSRGFAPRTPLHALSRAASPVRSDRVARSLPLGRYRTTHGLQSRATTPPHPCPDR